LLKKECPTINIFESIRTEILNCRILIKAITGDELNKNVQIGCFKNVLKIISDSCPNYIKTSPVDEIIKKTVENLTNVKEANLSQFQILSGSLIRRVSSILSVKAFTVEQKLEDIKKRMAETKAAAITAPADAKTAATAATPAAAEKKADAPATPASADKKADTPATPADKKAEASGTPAATETAVVITLPANTKEEEAFIKENKLDRLRYLTLSALLARTINTISDAQ